MTPPRRFFLLRRVRAPALVLTLIFLAGCRPAPPAAEFAPPGATLLAVAGELRRFSAQDFYERPFPVDLSGVNAIAAALVLLENDQVLHPRAQRDVVAFLMGEARLCLRDYAAAAAEFDRAARLSPADSPLRIAARERAALARELGELAAYPVSEAPIDAAVRLLDERRRALARFAAALADENDADKRPATALARVEAEQADVDWARAIEQTRALRPGGAREALAAWREVIDRHPRSRLRMRHRMAFARLAESLALEYLEAFPPETLRFVATAFESYANAARRAYLEVAQEDGFPEKLEARARLEAMNILVEEALRSRP